MEPRLRSKRSLPQAQLEPQTARSVDQRLTQWSSGAAVSKGGMSENNPFYLHNIPANKQLRNLEHSTIQRFRGGAGRADPSSNVS